MKISIITPVKNGEKYILETLRSIHEQGYPDIEHIVVDGLSKDKTVDIINEFIKVNSHKNIRLIVREDKNMYEAVNTGLSQISGDIFAYINSDDCYCRDTFEIVSGYFRKHEDVDMIYGNAQYIDEEGKVLFWSNNPPFNFNRLVRAGTSWIMQPETFWRRRVLEKAGYFDTSYKLASDYEYLLRVAKSCSVMGIKEVLVKFRVHGGSLSQSLYNIANQEAKEISQIYQSTANPLITYLLTTMDYLYIYALLIKTKNFRYIFKKASEFLKLFLFR
jgi:glycosyltransferase involved in cell wall biosynthesis